VCTSEGREKKAVKRKDCEIRYGGRVWREASSRNTRRPIAMLMIPHPPGDTAIAEGLDHHEGKKKLFDNHDKKVQLTYLVLGNVRVGPGNATFDFGRACH
jgi:hypothetical protein